MGSSQGESLDSEVDDFPASLGYGDKWAQGFDSDSDTSHGATAVESHEERQPLPSTAQQRLVVLCSSHPPGPAGGMAADAFGEPGCGAVDHLGVSQATGHIHGSACLDSDDSGLSSGGEGGEHGLHAWSVSASDSEPCAGHEVTSDLRSNGKRAAEHSTDTEGNKKPHTSSSSDCCNHHSLPTDSSPDVARNLFDAAELDDSHLESQYKATYRLNFST
jgi:hypothetical protein